MASEYSHCIVSGISGLGNCNNNAVAESFIGDSTELVLEPRVDVLDNIEWFFYRHRIHSSCDRTRVVLWSNIFNLFFKRSVKLGESPPKPMRYS